MAEETTFFDGFGEQKVLAERARNDINGESLELTISNNLVTAIGGVSVAGSGSETNIIETVEVEGTPLTVTNKTVNVTKADLSLNNVTNDSQVKRSEMGVANGVATLDAYGHIPSNQIPGSYDDVRNGYYYSGEFYFDAEHTQIMEHVDDILYVDVTTNIPYRWTGTTYTRTGSDLSLGTTEFTAYRGDHGLAAYEHSLVTSGNPHNVTKSDVGLGNVDNTSDSTKKSNFTGSIANSDTGFVTGGDVYTALSGKVDAVSGKGLSTNDYTTLEQTKLSGIESGAQVNTIESISYGGTALTPDNQKNVDVPAVVVANGGNINVTSTTADNTTTYAVSVDSTDFEVDQDSLKVTYPEGKIQLAVRNPLPTTEIDDSVLVGSYDTTGQEQGGVDTYNWRALTKTTVTDSPSNTDLYSALNSVKFLAERTYKDINGNSLELTISDNKVTAIGGKSVASVTYMDKEDSRQCWKDAWDSVAIIGGNAYKIVTIGTQTWMAENLDFKFPGLVVGSAGTSDSECRGNYYNNSEDTYGRNGNRYGMLYNWVAVNYLETNKASLIPGWHVPTAAEWDTLITFAGGVNEAGNKLKSTNGWNSNYGTDSYGFSCYGAGRYGDNNAFGNINDNAFFWTNSIVSSSTMTRVRLDSGNAVVNITTNNSYLQYSLRLVKDSV